MKIPDGYILKREPKSEHIQVLIRPNTNKALRDIALRESISRNELINQVLEEYISNRK